MANDLKVEYVVVGELKSATYNPRKWDENRQILISGGRGFAKTGIQGTCKIFFNIKGH